MKSSCPDPNSKSDLMENQLLTKQAKRGNQQSETHTFQWNGNGGVAICSCGYWGLWGASLESARQTHEYHRINRLASSAKRDAEATTDAD
jgi:hypothetical protein